MDPEYLSQLQKVQITLDIAKQLRYFEGPNGKVNLFNQEYTFVPKLKKIFQDYIHSDKQFKGTIPFEEINKIIEYRLPVRSDKKPLFVIRM
jgi:hypothetical protein